MEAIRTKPPGSCSARRRPGLRVWQPRLPPMPPYTPPTPAERVCAPEQDPLMGVTVRTMPPTRTRSRKWARGRQLPCPARRHHDHPDATPSAPGEGDRARPPDKLSPSAGMPLPGQSLLREGRVKDVWTDKRQDDRRAPTERGDRPDRPGMRREHEDPLPKKTDQEDCRHSRPM